MGGDAPGDGTGEDDMGLSTNTNAAETAGAAANSDPGAGSDGAAGLGTSEDTSPSVNVLGILSTVATTVAGVATAPATAIGLAASALGNALGAPSVSVNDVTSTLGSVPDDTTTTSTLGSAPAPATGPHSGPEGDGAGGIGDPNGPDSGPEGSGGGDTPTSPPKPRVNEIAATATGPKITALDAKARRQRAISRSKIFSTQGGVKTGASKTLLGG